MGPSGWQQVWLGLAIGLFVAGVGLLVTWLGPDWAGWIGIGLIVLGLNIAAMCMWAYEIERRVRLRLLKQPTDQVSADWRPILNRWIGEGDRLVEVLRDEPRDTAAVSAWLTAAQADMRTHPYTKDRIGVLSGPDQANPSPARRMRHYVEQLRGLLK